MAKRKEMGHVPKLVSELRTPPLNDSVYGVIRVDDPDVQELAKSIECNGILEPLVVSKDGYIISGNRRFTAATMLGMKTVPVRVEDVTIDTPIFNSLLLAHNKQRIKTFDQMLRENLASIDPESAMQDVQDYRKRKSSSSMASMDLGVYRGRARIQGNRPLADAAVKVVMDNREWWPMSDRRIHYLLLNVPPLLHNKKRDRYANDITSYKTLTNILTRLRICGEIQMQAICDDTRTSTIWQVYPHVNAYLSSALEDFLTGYYRDFMQSQPNHVEIIGEKLTVQPILLKVAQKYAIPLTIGRGFASLPPRAAIVERWKKSGKANLVIIMVTDFDPAGQTIASSLGRSLRDDFGVPEERLTVLKAALNKEQVERLGLPRSMEVKHKASTAKNFKEEHGNYVWELEAISPEALIELVEDALHSVLDINLVNAEKQKERDDNSRIAAFRKAVIRTLGHVPFSEPGEVFI